MLANMLPQNQKFIKLGIQPKAINNFKVEAESTVNFFMQQIKDKKLLSKDEAAFYLGISKRTLSNIINTSNFYPLVRIGCKRGRVFINREKLDQWINEQDGSYKS